MLPPQPPAGAEAVEQFLLDALPALGPPPRGAEGLARARRFFARLGSPQDATRQVHLVGTAGKGTAAAAVISHLVGTGLSVGAHLSPHVYDLRERFLLNGQLPQWHQVDGALAEMWPAMLVTEAEEGRPPSFFEVTTAMAWVIARAAGVDVQVTEAGIGGRHDATNAISRSDKITVITPIDFDHLDILGSEIGEIARNKADVIAPGSHVVVSPQHRGEAMDVIRAVARERGATIHMITRTDDQVSWTADADAVGLAVLDLLGPFTSVPPDRIAPALVHLPGRAEETLAARRSLVLDGAHNPLKLRALRELLSDKPVRLVIAALSHEKDLDGCARELARLSDVVIATDFAVAAGDRVVRRSWSSHQLAEAIHLHRSAASVIAVPGIDNAVAEAIRSTRPGDLIVATGSFMMLAPVRAAAAAADAAAMVSR